MKIIVGADHRGFERKTELLASLAKKGYQVTDAGTDSAESCDYPPIALKVSREVAAGKADRGILLCKSGVGMSIAANKVRGVRAALVQDLESARLSRRHNDANVLVLSAEQAGAPLGQVVDVWLKEPFEGGRHARRVEQIKAIEKENFK